VTAKSHSKAEKMQTPKPKNSKRELREFASWRSRLHRAYEKAVCRASKGGRTIPRKEPMNAFRLAAYDYYDQLRAHGLLGELRDYVEKQDGARWKGYDDHDVRWVIRLARGGGTKAYAHDTAAGRTRRQRDRRIAAELKLAAINKVRPGLLVGFLYEAGPTSKVERDAEAGKRYRWGEAYR